MDDFDLDAIEREMESLPAEVLAEMEQEFKNGFDFGQTFDEIFGDN